MSTMMPWGERVPDSRDEITTARAAADQQFALVTSALNSQVERARALLDHVQEVDAWAILGIEIAGSLDLGTKYQQFAGEVLAAAAIRLAKEN
jgi:hypothetical protein